MISTRPPRVQTRALGSRRGALPVRWQDRLVRTALVTHADTAAAHADVSGEDAAIHSELVHLDDQGRPTAEREHLVGLNALVERVMGAESGQGTRWVWPSTQSLYPLLLRRGVRVERCHDVRLTDALLAGHAGHWYPVIPDSPVLPEGTGAQEEPSQGALFDVPVAAPPVAPDRRGSDVGQAEPPQMPGGMPGLDGLLTRYREQLAAAEGARATSPGFALMVSAESAAALAAAEMSFVGLPWDAARHDALLTEQLGDRPAPGGRPQVLADLAAELAEILAAPGLNPDSQPDLLRALRRAGLPVRSTRRHELARLEHPVVAPLRRYKELSRLHSANGWAWREEWVHAGRFRPEYVPSGVVSGRWSSRGGGALQIPKALRGAVVADPGWSLVLADAGQLEPRILAALCHDPGLLAATADPGGDVYSALARRATSGRREVDPADRSVMKIALLSAMYGGGSSGPGQAALQRLFPTALAFLEGAARAGEDGRLVRSVLGRTCPPPAAGWLDGLGEPQAAARARARGRFTRNFVVQASAADWANVFIAGLRLRLSRIAGPQAQRRPDLVFFLHDEVIVHTPTQMADDVVRAIRDAGEQACRLVLPEPVPVPLAARIARSYDEKAGLTGVGSPANP